MNFTEKNLNEEKHCFLPVPNRASNTSSAEEPLRRLAEEGVKKRFSDITQEIRERIDYELKVITETHFCEYFLIVHEYVSWAKTAGIRISPGRGSSSSSLLNYALGITDINPLEYGLLFERFFNRTRPLSYPDIDVEADYNRRDEIITHIKNVYGSDHTAQIAAFEQMSTDAPQGSEACIRTVSIHAAGIVITAQPGAELVPVFKDKNGTTVIQLTDDSCDYCGVMRFDILGLRVLSELTYMENEIRKTDKDFSIDAVPLDDKKTLALYQHGDTQDVFQFDSPGLRDALKKLKPSSFNDLVLLNTVYRPGMMDYLPGIIKAKKNPDRIEYIEPCLQEVLAETYGIPIYQEQIMKIINIIAGMTYEKGDIIRRGNGQTEKKCGRRSAQPMSSLFIRNSKKSASSGISES